jgi:hypothetical protein
MIPCYACLAQSTPAGRADCQSIGLAQHQTAHRLYTIHQYNITQASTSNHA